MAMSTELKINRSLLDPNFDGYKLSLDPIPTYTLTLDTGVDEVRLTENQYSYQHIKAFGIHNHLVVDPWDHGLVYLVNTEWDVTRVMVSQTGEMTGPVGVFTIPDAANQRLVSERHNVTLQFASESVAVLADGAGSLHIIHTGARRDDATWKACHSCSPLDGGCFTLVHAVSHVAGDQVTLHCLLQHVKDAADTQTDAQTNGAGDRNVPAFLTVLEWLTFTSGDGQSWTLERTRRLEGHSTPDAAAVDSAGEAVYITAEKPLHFTHDSHKPVLPPQTPANDKEDMAEAPPAYTWMQSTEDVTLTFTLPPDTAKTDVAFKLTAGEVSVGVKSSAADTGVMTFLAGELYAQVDVEESTWTIDVPARRLEVILSKAECGSTWPHVVEGDTRGRLMLDAKQTEAIHERLAHLTSDKWNPDPEEDKKPAYNAQELEDCDAYPDQAAVCMRLDGQTHTVTHQANISSNQWLFTVQPSPAALPAVCLRHDVDGLLWQPEPPRQHNLSPWQHTATFNAFGYVHASKRDRKFVTCAPDCNYAVICDCTRHLYIYRQPAPTISPLRNRKTGRTVGAVAKQQLLSMPSTETIMGVVATRDCLYVLVGRTIYVARLNCADAS